MLRHALPFDRTRNAIGRRWRLLIGALLALGVVTISAPDALAQHGTGYLEICVTAGGLATGSATFTVDGQTVVVPAGHCSDPIALAVRRATITETDSDSLRPLTAIVVRPRDRLVSLDLKARTVTVRIVRGDVSRRTTVTYEHCPMCA